MQEGVKSFMYGLFDDYGGYGSGMDIFNVFSEFSDIINKIKTLIAFIAIVIGIIQCFWGYRLYRITLAISGFFTGATVGFIIGLLGAAAVDADADSIQGTVTFMIFIMLICGIAGAMIAYFWELVGAFLVGFSGVYIVSLAVSIMNKAILGDTNIVLSFFTSLIPAIITGILVVKFWKPIVIIYTGLVGALSIAAGSNLGILVFLLCAVCGIIYQIKSNGGLTDKPKTTSTTYTVYDDQSTAYYSPDQNNFATAPTAPVQNRNTKKDDVYPDIMD